MRSIVDQWDSGQIDQDAITAALVDAFEPALRVTLWRDLSVLLNDSEATRETVHRVLTTRTAPIVRVNELVTDSGTARRLLAGPQDAFMEEVRIHVTNAGVLGTSDPDVSIQVAMRPVPVAMRSEGGTDDPFRV